jgi:homoserine O-acetyltransferase
MRRRIRERARCGRRSPADVVVRAVLGGAARGGRGVRRLALAPDSGGVPRFDPLYDRLTFSSLPVTPSFRCLMSETRWPDQRESDYLIPGFRFGSGEVLDQLRLHYLTLGAPRRDGAGTVVNAVLLLHNTTGSARSWLTPSLADALFAPGRPLDATRHYIVMPDAIGFGASSKPSDGLRAGFPHYRYRDIVAAHHRFVTEGLGLTRLRLVLGLSMGGMLTWMWGGIYPDMMDALVPIASQPGPMSGRNWIQRRMNIEAIRSDPDWNGGNYDNNPTRWALTPFGALMTQSVVRLQERAPTREAADVLYREFVARAKAGDANDRLYQLEASMDYDPSGDLDRITAPLLAINFADDELNPPALGVLEPAIARMRGARAVTLPASPHTQGHYTTMQAALWAPHLGPFLAQLPSI